MTDHPETPSTAAAHDENAALGSPITALGSPITAPTEAPKPGLKAERVQLILIALDRGNRPYDFVRETEAERNARLENGWRKRTVDDPWRPRRRRDAA